MVVVPEATDVTKPVLSTVATVVSDEDQIPPNVALFSWHSEVL